MVDIVVQVVDMVVQVVYELLYGTLGKEGREHSGTRDCKVSVK